MEQNNVNEDGANGETNTAIADEIFKRLQNSVLNANLDVDEVFRALDKTETNQINLDDAKNIIRGLGYTVSDKELNAVFQETDTQNFSLKEIKDIILDNDFKKQNPTEIKEVVKSFDVRNNGMLSIWELKYVLMLLGERLSKEDFDEFLVDLPFNEKTGYIEIQHLLYLLGGEGGVSPESKKTKSKIRSKSATEKL